jgi:hypothetical protein
MPGMPRGRDTPGTAKLMNRPGIPGTPGDNPGKRSVGPVQKPMLSEPVCRSPASASGWLVTTFVSVIGSTLVSRFAMLSRTALTVDGVKHSGIPASLPQSLVA